MGLLGSRESTIVPCELQEPPWPRMASQSTCTVPLRSARLTLPLVKKPTERLSGDQNGSEASSVPSNGRAADESSDRTQSWRLPSRVAGEGEDAAVRRNGATAIGELDAAGRNER